MTEDSDTMQNQGYASKTGNESVIFKQQNVWYYTSPNGDKVGPFRYQSEARSSLEQFLSQLKDRLSIE